MYQTYIKRLLDFLLSLAALILLSPLLAAVALLVRIKLGRPVLFKQPRPGKDEKIFYLYKFRSMTNETDANGVLLPDAQRLTAFGRFLRASSIDELPELINILKGDMSIVGPRPLSVHYLPHYADETRARHAVRPGLTGLAQINGRNGLGWEERFALDVRYARRVTFAVDMKIVFGTVGKVLKGADVTVRGENSLRDFGPYSMMKEEENAAVKREGMTYREIGSFFWLEENRRVAADGSFREILPQTADEAFTFSGRAAIALALRDILAGRTVREAYLPSYCCVSMAQPFLDRGIKVRFYDVSYRNGAFTYDFGGVRPGDVLLAMNYFGFGAAAFHKTLAGLPAGVTVIEDITHSLLSGEPACDRSDYLAASLRKWFPTAAGGWVGKRTGALAEKPGLDSDGAAAGKLRGMREKTLFIRGETDDKEGFLALQTKFETDLIHADPLLRIDSASMEILQKTDVSAVTAARRRNASALYTALASLSGALLELPVFDPENDTPLFVPIFLAHEKRESLCAYLIQNGVYCPVHWPEVMGAAPGARENELSLICDQRYTESDMRVIAALIREWYALRQEG